MRAVAVNAPRRAVVIGGSAIQARLKCAVSEFWFGIWLGTLLGFVAGVLASS